MPGKVHADDIPVPVQEPGSGKTRTARLWVYVRDDRNAGSQMPPAVWFAYSPDRKGIHPQNHLAGYSGVLQADAYGGYRVLYESGRITEAACMAHARRTGSFKLIFDVPLFNVNNGKHHDVVTQQVITGINFWVKFSGVTSVQSEATSKNALLATAHAHSFTISGLT